MTAFCRDVWYRFHKAASYKHNALNVKDIPVSRMVGKVLAYFKRTHNYGVSGEVKTRGQQVRPGLPGKRQLKRCVGVYRLPYRHTPSHPDEIDTVMASHDCNRSPDSGSRERGGVWRVRVDRGKASLALGRHCTIPTGPFMSRHTRAPLKPLCTHRHLRR